MTKVRRIALFGKSDELWPVAALLGRDLPDGIKLVVVEDTAPVGPAAVTIRLDDPFLARLGIDADELRETESALFALGTILQDWTGDGSRYFHCGSGSLPAIEHVDIHQIMLRAALTYNQPERLAYLYQPFRLPARAAEAGKFAFQSSDPRSPLSMLRPTVQIDRIDYAALCRSRLTPDRVEVIQARPEAAQYRKENGTISGVLLDNQQMVEADFFIDMSGGLSEAMPAHPRADWQPIAGLPFDRLLSGKNPASRYDSKNHNIARAVDGGLYLATMIRDTSISSLLYASSDRTDAAAQKLLDGDAQPEPFEPGYVRQPWLGNLVRLGRASARFGPFLSADTILLQRQAMILADHLPARQDMTVEAREFNRRHLLLAEQIRDFMLLPFALNRRSDPVWSAMRESRRPDSLATRIDQFRSRGRFVAFEGEIFDEQSWLDLLIGFGTVPERYDPMARSLDMGMMARRLKKLTVAFDQALASLSD